MAKKNKNLWLYILIALAILAAILFVLFLKPNSQTGLNGGSSGGSSGGSTGGSPGGTGTVYIHDPCSSCQARWIASENTGFNVLIYDGDYGSASWECSGTCETGSCRILSGDIYDPWLKPVCTCEPRTTVKYCDEITAISGPKDCLGAVCRTNGQQCIFDTGRGICTCNNIVL